MVKDGGIQELEGEEIEVLAPPEAGAQLSVRNCTVVDLDWSEHIISGDVLFEECRFEGPVDISQTTFRESAAFRRCTFASLVEATGVVFSGTADFDGTTFNGPMQCTDASFQGVATLRDTRFAQKVSFDGACFSKFLSFKKALFQQECSLDNAQFRDTAQFHNVKVEGRFSAVEARFNTTGVENNHDEDEGVVDVYSVFSNSRFDDVVDFTEASFGASVRFVLCVFDQEVRFPNAKFKGYTSFDRARFKSVVIFQGATFEHGATLHLKDARIERIEIDYGELESVLHCLVLEAYEARLEERAALLREALKAGTAYPGDQRHLDRIEAALRNPSKARLEEGSRTLAVLHKAFNDSFNAKGEDWAYITLRRMERSALGSNHLLRRALSRFLDLTCGYGTNPWKVAASAGIVILIFTGIFLGLPESFDPSTDVSFRNALTFSFRTFTSSELDSHISPVGAVEWLVMLESVLGYVVMMLFVVTLSRLVIRS